MSLIDRRLLLVGMEAWLIVRDRAAGDADPVPVVAREGDANAPAPPALASDAVELRLDENPGKADGRTVAVESIQPVFLVTGEVKWLVLG